MTNSLSSILLLDTIVLDLNVLDKKQVFEQVGLIFENACGIPHTLVVDSLVAREGMGSTGLGYGVAVPHGRIEELKTPYAAFIRLATSIPFESPDGMPVNLLFVLLMPQKVLQRHLDILSEIAAKFSDAFCRDVLAHEMDKKRIYEIMTSWKPGQPLPS